MESDSDDENDSEPPPALDYLLPGEFVQQVLRLCINCSMSHRARNAAYSYALSWILSVLRDRSIKSHVVDTADTGSVYIYIPVYKYINIYFQNSN